MTRRNRPEEIIHRNSWFSAKNYADRAVAVCDELGVRSKEKPYLCRFFEKISFCESGCWVWTGAKNESGYGAFHSPLGKYAHRFSHEAFIGPIIGENLVCHSCDNPSCVNPEHLWQGTNLENNQDMRIKGRGVNPPVTNWASQMRRKPHHWQKITLGQAKEVKARLSDGERQCDIARAMNIPVNIVQKIACGDRWGHA